MNSDIYCVVISFELTTICCFCISQWNRHKMYTLYMFSWTFYCINISFSTYFISWETSSWLRTDTWQCFGRECFGIGGRLICIHLRYMFKTHNPYISNWIRIWVISYTPEENWNRCHSFQGTHLLLGHHERMRSIKYKTRPKDETQRAFYFGNPRLLAC